MSRFLAGVALSVSAAAAMTRPAVADLSEAPDTAAYQGLRSLSITDLANMEITSVSRRAEPLSAAPASVYVITNEDIRRSGAVSLGEALRLAPNLQVAQVGASSYAITARGLNIPSAATANKLLVLIDGRVVYTPLYAGVFWDAQDTMMEDIDRIEVISGPGGTLWGANAVNGVINIVTRKAQETTGGMVSAGVGSSEASIGARYGTRINDTTAVHLYAKFFDRGHSLTSTGANGIDSWQKTQAGFRLDYAADGDQATLQGDIYNGLSDSAAPRQPTIGGGNITASWTRTVSERSTVAAQIYFDRAQRFVSSGIHDSIDTAELTVQQNLTVSETHQLVWGGGYRISHDRYTPGPGTSFLDPASRTLQLGNAFAQDTIRVSDAVRLIVGLKLEHNTFTGLEYLPNARMTWRVSESATFWSAVSRAVRTPARFDRDIVNPGIVAGGPTFQSERLIAYEAGYRQQLGTALSAAVSVYYNDYDRLRTAERSATGGFPLTVQNQMKGTSHGLEAWMNYTPIEAWRLTAGVNVLETHLKLLPGSRDLFGVGFAGNDPDYQLFLRSYWTFSDRVGFYVGARAIDTLTSPAVRAYAEIDSRLSWQVTDHVELSLAGYNLLHRRHPEFVLSSIQAREIPRSVYGTARWTF